MDLVSLLHRVKFYFMYCILLPDFSFLWLIYEKIVVLNAPYHESKGVDLHVLFITTLEYKKAFFLFFFC